MATPVKECVLCGATFVWVPNPDEDRTICKSCEVMHQSISIQPQTEYTPGPDHVRPVIYLATIWQDRKGKIHQVPRAHGLRFVRERDIDWAWRYMDYLESEILRLKKHSGDCCKCGDCEWWDDPENVYNPPEEEEEEEAEEELGEVMQPPFLQPLVVCRACGGTGQGEVEGECPHPGRGGRHETYIRSTTGTAAFAYPIHHLPREKEVQNPGVREGDTVPEGYVPYLPGASVSATTRAEWCREQRVPCGHTRFGHLLSPNAARCHALTERTAAPGHYDVQWRLYLRDEVTSLTCWVHESPPLPEEKE